MWGDTGAEAGSEEGHYTAGESEWTHSIIRCSLKFHRRQERGGESRQHRICSRIASESKFLTGTVPDTSTTLVCP